MGKWRRIFQGLKNVTMVMEKPVSNRTNGKCGVLAGKIFFWKY